MKESNRIVIEFEPAEEEAFETVLNTLERMTYLYEENDTDVILGHFQGDGFPYEILDGVPQRAIQALEEILGQWS